MNDAQWASLLQTYAASRDTALRDQLLEGYLPLARSVAGRFVGRGVEREDLEQVAAIALLKALERFEPERGFRFTTYAVPTIAGELRNYVRDRGGAIRMPREGRQRLYRMQQAQEAFLQAQGREPSVAELADAMGIALDELLMLLDMRNQTDVVSLDTPVQEDGVLADLLGGEDDSFAASERRDWMKWVREQLSDQERELLSLRFEQQLGQRETARQLGVSQMQVSRLERRMLSRLRAIEQHGGA